MSVEWNSLILGGNELNTVGPATGNGVRHINEVTLIIIIIIIIIILILILNLNSAIMPLGGYRGAGGTGR